MRLPLLTSSQRWLCVDADAQCKLAVRHVVLMNQLNLIAEKTFQCRFHKARKDNVHALDIRALLIACIYAIVCSSTIKIWQKCLTRVHLTGIQNNLIFFLHFLVTHRGTLFAYEGIFVEKYWNFSLRCEKYFFTQGNIEYMRGENETNIGKLENPEELKS